VKILDRLLGRPFRIRVLRAFQPGDIVFIECNGPVSAEAASRIGAYFKEYVPEIRCVLLCDGLRVVAREESGEA
jgi:hypothetical protein